MSIFNKTEPCRIVNSNFRNACVKVIVLVEYYNPFEVKLKEMERKYIHTPVALDVVDMIKQEAKLYHENYQYYNYVFCGIKKV